MTTFDFDYQTLQEKYNQLWNNAKNEEEKNELLKLYKYIRDIHHGKGLYTLSYYLLDTITYHVFEKQTLSIARYHKLIENQLKGTEHEPAFGCWKDMKHFLTFFMASYLYDINNRESIVDSILMIHVIPQLVKDRNSMSVCEPVSLCGKWMPRESSRKHKWLAKKCHTDKSVCQYIFFLRAGGSTVWMRQRHH